MNTLIGLFIIALGSFGQSSSYVPIKKVKNWAWESFWLVQGIFAWVFFPLLGASLGVPDNVSLFGAFGMAPIVAVLKTVAFGVLWGVGGLTFGLSMRYLGVALGQSLALGTCSAFGTLIPAILAGEQLFTGKGLVLLGSVSVAIAGIATIGYAGTLRAKNMTEEDKRKAIKDFALKKGLLIALLAGVMSACFNLGLEAGVKRFFLDNLHAPPRFAGLPATLLVTFGGFLTNAGYCVYQNIVNKTGKDYLNIAPKVLINNVLFCALAGGLWYSQFFGFDAGQSFFQPGTVIMAFSWSILMSFNVLFSNVWGIVLKEWKGCNRFTMSTLVAGLAILVLSVAVAAINNLNP